MQPAELGARRAAAEIAVFAVAAAESLESGPPPEVADFHDEIVAALTVYLDGSREAFETHARERALEIDWVETLAEEGRLPELWEEKARTLRAAPLATEGVEVRPLVLRGVDLHPLDGTSAIAIDRPGRVPWLPATTEDTVDVYEVRVPARMAAALDGEPMTFDGRVGLRLAHDRAAARWVLLGLTLYDAPNGISLGMPAL